MRLIVLLTVIVTGQISASALGDNQPWQQLANELNIDNAATIDSLQGAFQSTNDTSSSSRAQKACRIFRAVFNHVHLGENDPTEYLGQQSHFYINRTESNWYVRKIPACREILQP